MFENLWISIGVLSVWGGLLVGLAYLKYKIEN
jgi:hypothetical protein